MRVFANSRSITHAGTGQTEVSALPDVCKTPSPAGPVPIPYVNTAMDSQLAAGARSVRIEGNAVALESSNLRISTGDEPGTLGGIISSKFKGKLTWGSSSSDVLVEGKGVVRFMDVTQHNGNTFNVAFIEDGGTGFAYGDDFDGDCPICKKDAKSHAAPELLEGSAKFARAILADLKAAEEAVKKQTPEIDAARARLTRLTKDNAKGGKIEEAASKLAALELALVPLTTHRRPKSNGYMFGVMVCLTGKKFAAVSGGDTPAGFSKIAEKHVDEVITDAARVDDFVRMNPRRQDPAARNAMETKWETARLAHEAGLQNYRNAPGTCAGAKLIGKSKHVAQSMTEIFFSWAGNQPKTFNVRYIGPSAAAPDVLEREPGGPIKRWKPSQRDLSAPADMNARTDMKRDAGDTVPSCQSCQDTLSIARCDLEKQSCG